MKLAQGEPILLVHAPLKTKQRVQLLVEPNFSKFGDTPILVPSFWGLEKTLQKLLSPSQEMWRRQKVFVNYDEYNWIATVIATDNASIAKVEFSNDLLPKEKVFLGVEGKHYYIRLPIPTEY